MDDSAFAEEAGSSEEVGVRVEVGKRRKVVFPEAGWGQEVKDEMWKKLRCLSEEDRERCMRTFAVPSDGELSSLSDENSGGAATRVALLMDESALTPCG